MSIEPPVVPDFDDYDGLLRYLTSERLGSYLTAVDGDVRRAFALYEWNMRAASSVMELTSMIEVVVRNALDRELRSWADLKQPGSEWFDTVPLDHQGTLDLRKARGRATRNNTRSEVHGRVIAELSLGFWTISGRCARLTTAQQAEAGCNASDGRRLQQRCNTRSDRRDARCSGADRARSAAGRRSSAARA